MSYSNIFFYSHFLVLPFWLLMIVAPNWSWTRRIITSPLIALPAALLYLVLVIPQLLPVLQAILTFSVEAVGPLLGTPAVATLAWVHFLAIDLLTGRWVYLDSRERGVNDWLMGVVIFWVFMLGPVGVLLYLAVRAYASQRQSTLHLAEASM
jgi:Domain of unknown function (DUF4281)